MVSLHKNEQTELIFHVLAIEKMNMMMQTMYPRLISIAEAYALPLIDLPNTFDPRFSDLFCSQIEPSAFGSSLIAKMIAHVFDNHEWTQSKFYACSPENYKKIPSTTNVELQNIEATVNDGTNWSIKGLPDLSRDDINKWATNLDEEESSEEENEEGKFAMQLKLLEEMGFKKEECLPLLKATNGDVVQVIDLLNSD